MLSSNKKNNLPVPVKASPHNRGFALIATIVIMSLLLLISIAFLGMATTEVKTARIGDSQAQAEANAKLALMIAIGELQKEMGPDMRISAQSSLFDTDKNTIPIDGVEQSRWTASYNSWGDWLTAEYAVPDAKGNPGSPLKIQDTYVDKRKPMFRRWLLNLPEDQIYNIDAPLTGGGLTDTNSTIIVGRGTLGDGAEVTEDQITRAYLTPLGNNGNLSWAIFPENQKAKTTLSFNKRDLSVDKWEASQGGTTEVGVGNIEGFTSLDSLTDIDSKIATHQSLRLADVEKTALGSRFFDLTTHGHGILSSSRTGGLKKDISLLFELNSNDLPDTHKYKPNEVREPSIRPMSPELLAKNPIIPNRHFASWTNMRHYYRMYKSSSDAKIHGTGGTGNLQWNGYNSAPSTPVTSRKMDGTAGGNNYIRQPLLAKLTFIYSLQSVPVPKNQASDPQLYNCYLVYTPIYTFWNPYNVELKFRSRDIGTLSLPYKILPLGLYLYINNSQHGGVRSIYQGLKQDYGSFFHSSDGSDIVLKPGELKIFSYRSNGSSSSKQTNFYPGFDPQAIGGDKLLIHQNVRSDQRPGMSMTFGDPSGSGGNVWFGNTPGGLNNPFFWRTGGNGNWLQTCYQHDWLRSSERNTRITPAGNANVGYWQFGDSEPVPFAFNQLAMKTSSELEYESISWEKDWRSKNWMQSPSYYFGGGLFISENKNIADTQRLDSPYVFHFGPMSAADMPKVVPHINDNSFLGSGSSPNELVSAAPMLELPTAPLSSLAGFSNMRINPGWVKPDQFPNRSAQYLGPWNSLNNYETKILTYQSGVTGPAIGNSFLHPMLPRNGVYRFFDNSKSYDVSGWMSGGTIRDSQVFNDYWDHALLLNDALWDDYFVSTISDATRPVTSTPQSLSTSINSFLTDGEAESFPRYKFNGLTSSIDDIETELKAQDGYLKASKYFIVDGMFNVNSTSVDAWYALFSGIRERKVIYRNGNTLAEVEIPSDKTIALSRFNTATSNLEMDDAETGSTRADGQRAWTGVRFLDDDQLRTLAEECVKQVKLRGPFLNYSEFINRRLSNDALGVSGALQSAIDYDDAAPENGSINYRFKNEPSYMVTSSDLFAGNQYSTPEAATGSRFTGIPGYVIQSDLLKPISNTLNVRDDTFRIRAYGEVKDDKGNVIAKAWCEAIVQRQTKYMDDSNDPEVPARKLNADGEFEDNSDLSEINRKFGRKFRVMSFRWLNQKEV